MRFKDTFLITGVKWMKGIQKVATVETLKTNSKGEKKPFIFKAFEKDAEKAEKLINKVVVAELIVMSSNTGFCSEVAFKNPIKMDLPDRETGNGRTYDQNHY